MDDVVVRFAENDMAPTILPHETLTLSRVTVDTWLEEKRNIERDMEALRVKWEAVNSKLDAAKLLLPTLADYIDGVTTPKPKSQRSVIDRIVEVLEQEGEALTPKEIRDRLGDDDRVASASSNYLYTAISRAFERGLIAKTEEGAYLVPQSRLSGLESDGA